MLLSAPLPSLVMSDVFLRGGFQNAALLLSTNEKITSLLLRFRSRKWRHNYVFV
jgi:hypothetical protein